MGPNFDLDPIKIWKFQVGLSYKNSLVQKGLKKVYIFNDILFNML